MNESGISIKKLIKWNAMVSWLFVYDTWEERNVYFDLKLVIIIFPVALFWKQYCAHYVFENLMELYQYCPWYGSMECVYVRNMFELEESIEEC